MTEQIKQVLQKLTKDQWEDLDDAYGQYKIIKYTKLGFPEPFVKQFVTVFKSDGTYKGSLWKDPDKALGQIAKIREYKTIEEVPQEVIKAYNDNLVAESEGVYSLTFLTGLARELNVDYEQCLGRGRQARYIVTALQKHLSLPLTCDF